jgi:acyl-CoA synthetase (AMP-forming)/AMP-acid ligase II
MTEGPRAAARIAGLPRFRAARTRGRKYAGSLREELAPYKRPSASVVVKAVPTAARGTPLKAPLRGMLKSRV